MPDYDQILARAIAVLDPDSGTRRQDVYDRARKTLIDNFRPNDPALKGAAFRRESSALEAAIRRVEADAIRGADLARAYSPLPGGAASFEGYRDRAPLVDTRNRLRVAAALVALLVLAAGWIGYHYRADLRPIARAIVSPPPVSQPAEQVEDDKSYVYMRQVVYYRTNYPPGTLVVDKGQSFLYLVKPRLAAVRYTINVGQLCNELAGLYHILRKEEWPGLPAQPAVNISEAQMKNPFGARALDLTDDYRIHGTGAIRAARQILSKRCIGLVNDDVIDLYDRATVGGRVVVLAD